MGKTILVVDIETTGFLNQGGKIVEIGIVKLNLVTGEIKPVFDSLIKESGLDLSHTMGQFGWIFKNSNLKYDEITMAPSLEDCRIELQALFDSYQATVYNKDFDFDFLKDRGFIIEELPCPMLLATPILKIKNRNRYGTFKWPNVEETWRFFFGNTSYVEAHRAIDDAKHEAKIVHQLYRMSQFVVSSICLEAKYREMYRDESSKTVFVYSVWGTFEELLAFKEAQGAKYKSDKDGIPLFLSQVLLSFDKKKSTSLIVQENGQIVADNHEKILDRKSMVERAIQKEKIRNENKLKLKIEDTECTTSKEINGNEEPDFENYSECYSNEEFCDKPTFEEIAELNGEKFHFKHSPILTPIFVKGFWGFCDEYRNILIPCKYDEVKSFSEGLAPIYLNEKWGFINFDGKAVIPFVYQDAEPFSEGLAAVVSQGHYGFVNRSGIQKIQCIHGQVSKFSEGLAFAATPNGNGGTFIDKKSIEVIFIKYDGAEPFSEGVAVVYLNGKCGFIDRSGEEIIPLIYDTAESFSEGLAVVSINDRYYFIDHLGEKDSSITYDYAESFSEGLALVSVNKKFGFRDNLGNYIIPMKYDSARSYSNGVTVVELNNKYGFIDTFGKEVVPLKYDYIGPFDHGVAEVRLYHASGFIDQVGNLTIPFKNYGSDFGELSKSGPIRVGSNKYGLIDHLGNELAPKIYDLIYFDSEKHGVVKYNERYGYVNQSGKLLTEIKYNCIGRFHEKLAAVEINGKWGFIDETGKEISAIKYDEESYFNRGYATIKLNVRVGRIDCLGNEYW